MSHNATATMETKRSVSRLQDQLYLDSEYWSKLMEQAGKADKNINKLVSLIVEDWLEQKLGWPLGSGKRISPFLK